jgi:hypothetical protein
LLVHCFAGCAVGEVVGAVGLTISDLFPVNSSLPHRVRPEARSFPATDVLRATAHEALIVAIAGSRLGNGFALSNEDRARVLLATIRINTAVEESGHD